MFPAASLVARQNFVSLRRCDLGMDRKISAGQRVDVDRSQIRKGFWQVCNNFLKRKNDISGKAGY